MMDIIREQHTEENPLIIDNWPYGFKTTQMGIWIESVKGKEDIKDLVIDYLKKGCSHKDILKEMEAVIYWELIDKGFKK